jgi:hypothetical protein
MVNAAFKVLSLSYPFMGLVGLDYLQRMSSFMYFSDSAL